MKNKEPSEKEIKELHEAIECSKTQVHLKECRECRVKVSYPEGYQGKE